MSGEGYSDREVYEHFSDKYDAAKEVRKRAGDLAPEEARQQLADTLGLRDKLDGLYDAAATEAGAVNEIIDERSRSIGKEAAMNEVLGANRTSSETQASPESIGMLDFSELTTLDEIKSMITRNNGLASATNEVGYRDAAYWINAIESLELQKPDTRNYNVLTSSFGLRAAVKRILEGE